MTRFADTALARACAMLACALVAVAMVPVAFAAEGVTRSIEGVNYTIPSDWEELEASDAELVEQGFEQTGVDQIRAYTKEDALFVALSMRDGELADLTLTDMQAACNALNVTDGGLSLGSLVNMPFVADCAVEQGWPTLTVSTEQIELNGVTYRLTFKLFSVDGGTFEGGVVMVSLLPTSGQVTENFADSFPVLSEPYRVAFPGLEVTIPAGCTLIEGSLLGFDFDLALFEDDDETVAVALAIGIPFLVDDGSFTLEDLREATDVALDELTAEGEGIWESLWIGAYEFLGCPTVGCEATIDGATFDAPELGTYYYAATLSMSRDGSAALLFVEPSGYGLAREVLESAQPLTTGTATVQDALSPEATADLGFVVGL